MGFLMGFAQGAGQQVLDNHARAQATRDEMVKERVKKFGDDAKALREEQAKARDYMEKYDYLQTALGSNVPEHVIAAAAKRGETSPEHIQRMLSAKYMAKEPAPLTKTPSATPQGTPTAMGQPPAQVPQQNNTVAPQQAAPAPAQQQPMASPQGQSQAAPQAQPQQPKVPDGFGRFAKGVQQWLNGGATEPSKEAFYRRLEAQNYSRETIDQVLGFGNGTVNADTLFEESRAKYKPSGVQVAQQGRTDAENSALVDPKLAPHLNDEQFVAYARAKQGNDWNMVRALEATAARVAYKKEEDYKKAKLELDRAKIKGDAKSVQAALYRVVSSGIVNYYPPDTFKPNSDGSHDLRSNPEAARAQEFAWKYLADMPKRGLDPDPAEAIKYGRIQSIAITLDANITEETVKLAKRVAGGKIENLTPEQKAAARDAALSKIRDKETAVAAWEALKARARQGAP